MELVYLIMMGASAVGMMYYIILIYLPGVSKKRTWVFLPLLVILVISFIGLSHEGGVERDTNAEELKSMGFSHVKMLFNSGADVASFSSCPTALQLNKTAGQWVVVTDEIASEKPVVDEKELFDREEIKWWCSKPPIKN